MSLLKKYYLLIIFCIFLFFASLQSVLAAWQAPTTSPPDGNSKQPLTQGTIDESKAGGLSVGGNLTTLGKAKFFGSVGLGVDIPSTKLEVAQNNAIKVGNAYLSSGGDYTHLANNEWYNGSSGWTSNGNPGVLYQQTGQANTWYTHNGGGAHTQRMSLDQNGNLTATGYIQAAGSYYGLLNYAGYGGYFYGSGGAYAQNTSGYVAYLAYPGSSWSVYGNGNMYTSGYIQAGSSYYGLLNYAGYGGYFYGSGGVFAQNTSGYYAYLGYPGSGWSVYANGSIYAAGGVYSPAFYYYSDVTLKKDITSISNSLTKVERLRGVSFVWKEDNRKDLGFIAQEVEKVFPELVRSDDKGLKSVEYANIIPVLVEAIKEQQKQINDQRQEIENLKQGNL